MSERLFIFAGGGTGGHLFPGLAIAEALVDADPDARALFLCSDKPLDAQILSSENARSVAVPARPLIMRPRGITKLMRSWGPSVRIARSAIAGRQPAGPRAQAVVALGGYVAAPVVQAARAERIPVVLVNLDAVPGKANRWIARHSDVRLTASEILKGPASASGWQRIPPLVRKRALASGTPQECRTKLGLDPDRATLLVTGGSQGAGSINAFVLALARTHPQAMHSWQVLHQAGAQEADAVRAAWAQLGVPARVEGFIRAMGDAWGAADVAVSRCGAGSVAEAWANATPAIFLPYPWHKDQHQRWNARSLEAARAAVIVDDLIDGPRTLAACAEAVLPIFTDAGIRQAMRGAYAALGPANGAQCVARLLAAGVKPG